MSENNNVSNKFLINMRDMKLKPFLSINIKDNSFGNLLLSFYIVSNNISIEIDDDMIFYIQSYIGIQSEAIIKTLNEMVDHTISLELFKGIIRSALLCRWETKRTRKRINKFLSRKEFTRTREILIEYQHSRDERFLNDFYFENKADFLSRNNILRRVQLIHYWNDLICEIKKYYPFFSYDPAEYFLYDDSKIILIC